MLTKWQSMVNTVAEKNIILEHGLVDWQTPLSRQTLFFPRFTYKCFEASTFTISMVIMLSRWALVV